MYIIDHPKLIVSDQREECISAYRIKDIISAEITVFHPTQKFDINMIINMDYIINTDDAKIQIQILLFLCDKINYLSLEASIGVKQFMPLYINRI